MVRAGLWKLCPVGSSIWRSIGEAWTLAGSKVEECLNSQVLCRSRWCLQWQRIQKVQYLPLDIGTCTVNFIISTPFPFQEVMRLEGLVRTMWKWLKFVTKLLAGELKQLARRDGWVNGQWAIGHPMKEVTPKSYISWGEGSSVRDPEVHLWDPRCWFDRTEGCFWCEAWRRQERGVEQWVFSDLLKAAEGKWSCLKKLTIFMQQISTLCLENWK